MKTTKTKTTKITRAAYRKIVKERDAARIAADLAEQRYQSLLEHAETTRAEFEDKLTRIKNIANNATRESFLGPVSAVEALVEKLESLNRAE